MYLVHFPCALDEKVNLVPITPSWPEVEFHHVFLGSNWQADSKIYCESKGCRIANTIWRIYMHHCKRDYKATMWYGIRINYAFSMRVILSPRG